MSWPQRFENVAAGSQYGSRVFLGKSSFHWGRDQAVAAGRAHIARAAGTVVGRSRTNTFGFYVIVVYDGDPLRHHVHQLQDGGRPEVGSRFARGAVLGYVGDPLLHVPWAQRSRYPSWSGSDQSSGPHCHEEGRTGVSISTAIDLRGSAATAAWARISRAQTIPAGSGATPIGDDMSWDEPIDHPSNGKKVPAKAVMTAVISYLDQILAAVGGTNQNNGEEQTVGSMAGWLLRYAEEAKGNDLATLTSLSKVLANQAYTHDGSSPASLQKILAAVQGVKPVPMTDDQVRQFAGSVATDLRGAVADSLGHLGQVATTADLDELVANLAARDADAFARFAAAFAAAGKR